MNGLGIQTRGERVPILFFMHFDYVPGDERRNSIVLVIILVFSSGIPNTLVF